MTIQLYLAQEQKRSDLRNTYLRCAFTFAQQGLDYQMTDMLSRAMGEYPISDEALREYHALCNRVSVAQEKEYGIHVHDEECGCPEAQDSILSSNEQDDRAKLVNLAKTGQIRPRGKKAQIEPNPCKYEAPTDEQIQEQAWDIRKLADRSRDFTPGEKDHVHRAVDLALNGEKDSMIAEIAMVDRGTNKNLVLDLIVGLYNRVTMRKMMMGKAQSRFTPVMTIVAIRQLILTQEGLTRGMRDDYIAALGWAIKGNREETLSVLDRVGPNAMGQSEIKTAIMGVLTRVERVHADEAQITEHGVMIDVAITLGALMAQNLVEVKDSRSVPDTVQTVTDNFLDTHKETDWAKADYTASIDEFAREALLELYAKEDYPSE